MMNGTVRGYGNENMTDTEDLAIKLGRTPRHTWKQSLAKFDARFVAINTRTRSFQIFNKHLYTYKDGVWYSKDNVLQTQCCCGVWHTEERIWKLLLVPNQFKTSWSRQDQRQVPIGGQVGCLTLSKRKERVRMWWSMYSRSTILRSRNLMHLSLIHVGMYESKSLSS